MLNKVSQNKSPPFSVRGSRRNIVKSCVAFWQISAKRLFFAVYLPIYLPIYIFLYLPDHLIRKLSARTQPEISRRDFWCNKNFCLMEAFLFNTTVKMEALRISGMTMVRRTDLELIESCPQWIWAKYLCLILGKENSYHLWPDPWNWKDSSRRFRVRFEHSSIRSRVQTVWNSSDSMDFQPKVRVPNRFHPLAPHWRFCQSLECTLFV